MTIRKTKDGYRVLSEKTKRNMGTYPTKKDAEKRLEQIEMFKKKPNKGGKKRA
jgi:hypothetical protein